MLQPNPVPATALIERVRTGAGRRTLGIALTLLIEIALLLLLLSLGATGQRDAREKTITLVNLKADEVPDEPAEQIAEAQPAPPPATEQPLPPPPQSAEPPIPQLAEPRVPLPRTIIPSPSEQPPPAAIPATPIKPVPSARPLYGPPDRGRSASRDTERVGTAPNGEPLYAAAWYREPGEELRAYLSTARGPGWGLIACRTAPDYRVEDCVGLDEYPYGSQITRAVLAAAWEFKVRPPQLGGRSLVGSWVRIRIDYGAAPR